MGVSELALDDDQRHSFMRHLDGVRMTELMRREPPPDARACCGARQLLAGRGWLPAPARSRAANHTRQRADRQLTTGSHPRLQLRPRPAIHPDLATTAALAVTHQDRAARGIQVGLREIGRLTDPQTRPPQNHDQRAQPGAVGAAAGFAHHRDDLLDRGRVRRIPPALVSGSTTLVKAGHRDRRPAMTSRVIQDGLHLLPPTGACDGSVNPRSSTAPPRRRLQGPLRGADTPICVGTAAWQRDFVLNYEALAS